MSVQLSPVGGAAAQFFDNDGNPLAGGLIYTYAAGSTTPQPTYTTSTGGVAHTNPIVLDASGRVPGGEIWIIYGVAYKFVIKDATGAPIGSYDNITTVGNFTGDGIQTDFYLSIISQNDSISIYINGVYQNANSYTAYPNMVSFSEAPPINSSIEIINKPLSPLSTVKDFTGNGTQTKFLLPIPLVSFVMVYIDGVYQSASTYTLINNLLTFSKAPPVNSIIELVY